MKIFFHHRLPSSRFCFFHPLLSKGCNFHHLCRKNADGEMENPTSGDVYLLREAGDNRLKYLAHCGERQYRRKK